MSATSVNKRALFLKTRNNAEFQNDPNLPPYSLDVNGAIIGWVPSGKLGGWYVPVPYRNLSQKELAKRDERVYIFLRHCGYKPQIEASNCCMQSSLSSSLYQRALPCRKVVRALHLVPLLNVIALFNRFWMQRSIYQRKNGTLKICY